MKIINKKQGVVRLFPELIQNSGKVRLFSRKACFIKKVKSFGNVRESKELSWELLPGRKGYKRGVGRNHHGRITVRHRGGGHKRRYRVLGWRPKEGDLVQCMGVYYDPNRRGFIAAMGAKQEIQRKADMNSLFWMLAPEGMVRGDWMVWKADRSKGLDVLSGSDSKQASEYLLKGKLAAMGNVPSEQLKLFERKPLGDFAVDSLVYGISLKAGEDGEGVLARAAGACAEVVAHYPEVGLVEVVLPSGVRVKLPSACYARRGQVSNGALKSLTRNRERKKLEKAGDNRHRGKRPTVRGIAMNPVDHPHGGRTNGGRPSVSPWGHLTKGGKKTGRLSRKTATSGVKRVPRKKGLGSGFLERSREFIV